MIPARKRFILLLAAHCLAGLGERSSTGRSEHGIGSRSGIFSGCWVNCPNGRMMLAGLFPLHDAGTIFCCRCFCLSLNNAVAVSLLLLFAYAADTWLNRTPSWSILKMLRSSILATMIRAMFLPCLATARSKASW